MKKRFFAVLCTAVLVVSLAACGGKKDEKAKTPEAEGPTIDYESTEIQELTDEKVEQSVLSEVAKDWLGGYTMFFPGQEQAEYTYEDFVEKIGVEASTYNKYEDGGHNWRAYTWIASDNETAKFAAYFEESDGKWVLRAVGTVNL